MDRQQREPPEFATLEYFLRGYLHEDWKQEHGSLKRAAQQFCEDANSDERDQVLTEWQEFVESAKAQPLDEIARRLIAAGVVWERCQGCDRPWPFPTGFDPDRRREWLCAVCVNAQLARTEREPQ